MSFRVDDSNIQAQGAGGPKKPYVKPESREIGIFQGSNQYAGLPKAELTIAKEIVQDKIAELNTEIEKLKKNNADPAVIQEKLDQLVQMKLELGMINNELGEDDISSKSINIRG